jgi:tetratricopeptide (TPR) repeat protein
MDPENINAYSILSSVYVQNGDTDKALELVNKALSLIPSASEKGGDLYPEAQLYFVKAMVHTELKEYDQSIEYLKKSIRMDPNLASPYLEMADVYRKMGKIKESDKALENWFEKAKPPITSKEFNDLGIAYYFKGDNIKALENMNKSINLEPGIPKAYFDRALIYIKIGKKDLAKADLKKVVKIDKGVDRVNAEELLVTL